MFDVSSPIAAEGRLPIHLSGRAESVEPDLLRPDFGIALERVLAAGETVRRTVAVRSLRIMSIDIRPTVLLLTDRAVIHLWQPEIVSGVPTYGVRATIVACEKIAYLELGQRLLRGTLRIGFWRKPIAGAPVLRAGSVDGATIEVLYHALDEQIFAEFLREIRG